METSLGTAVKLGFLSYDSAMRSNLGVARPIDVLVMPRDPSRPLLQTRVNEDDAYFNMLSQQWADSLRDAVRQIPQPPFMDTAE